MRARCLPFLFHLIVLLGLVCFAVLGCEPSVKSSGDDPESPAKSGAVDKPRLAVLVIFDQMRGDYLTRWQKLFDKDGFGRLLADGAWFQNCHYPYANTATAPGHASLLTGCSPATHGIIENTWYERAAGKSVYCVADERDDVSPARLLAPTLGDALHAATGGKGRVVSLSHKDRSAILPAGHTRDASCYWVNDRVGKFVTSTYYARGPRPWVKDFNPAQYADQWFGKDWTRLRPKLDYTLHSGPDDVEGEGKGYAQGRTFPHPMKGGEDKPGREFYKAVYNSPYGNELLLELVKRAIDGEKLGRGDAPDLLCVSFSSNDVIGHCWGPDSQEVFDTTLRSDLIVKELLAHLDAKVGKGRYVFALSADHGVCPIPEVARAQGKDAGRVSHGLLDAQAEEFLQQTFGKPKDEETHWIELLSDNWFYLNQRLLKERGLKSAKVEEALAGWLRKKKEMQAVYTRSQLLQDAPKDDPVGQRVRRSFHPERSGDVAVVLKPYYQLTSYLTGTSHGTPHPYDTHVPLVVYGPGVKGGVREEEVTPQAVVAILAHALGIKPPAKAEAPVPDKLFQ